MGPMPKKTVWKIRTYFYLSFVLGCSSGQIDDPIYKPPTTTVLYHRESTCKSNYVIFRDNGILCENSWGSFKTHPDLIGLWKFNITTGEMKRLIPFGIAPSASIAGERFYFQSDQRQIMSALLDGTDIRQLTVTGRNMFPSVSSSGDLVLYSTNDETQGGIWVMNSTGQNSRRIVTHGEMPDWSPDEDGFVFVSGLGLSSGTDVFLSDLTGVSVKLTNTINVEERYPKFSHSGTRIAYQAQDLSSGAVNIYVMNLATHVSIQVTQHGGLFPTWSPLDSSIVYIRPSISTDEIYGNMWIYNILTMQHRPLLIHSYVECD
jgi:hypothetical protein